MSWVSAPDWAALNSAYAQRSQPLKPSALSRKTNSAKASFELASQESLSGTTSPRSIQSPGSESSMLLQPASLASPSRAPGCASASMTRGGSGLTSRRPFAYYDRDTSSWKTSQGCLVPGMDTFSETWPRWVSVSRLESFLADPWAPAISVTESQSWPTATSMDQDSLVFGNGSLKLSGAAKSWPTPKACNADKGGSTGSPNYADGTLRLTGQVKQWPTPTAASYGSNQSPSPGASVRPSLDQLAKTWSTPTAADCQRSSTSSGYSESLSLQAKNWPTATARDWKSGKSNQAHNARPLSEVVERCGPRDQEPTGNQSPAPSGRLNSRFVEWLQGFPENWSRIEEPVCAHWETLIRHQLRLWLGES